MYAFTRRRLLVLATIAVATHALEPRLASSCSAFTGPGVFDTANNFTLTAVPVDPADGAPRPLLVNNVATALKISWLILSAVSKHCHSSFDDQLTNEHTRLAVRVLTPYWISKRDTSGQSTFKCLNRCRTLWPYRMVPVRHSHWSNSCPSTLHLYIAEL